LLSSGRRIIVFDGGMGTTLRRLGAPEGAPERLNVDAPDLVRRAHEEFLRAGADVIETNTLGGSAPALAESGLGGRCYELNRRAARIARSVADHFENRYVAGSIGPGTKLPSLGQITFAALRAGHTPQVSGLLAGGVDCLIVETCQDLLQLKAALVAIDDALQRTATGPRPRIPGPRSAWRVPVIASVTLDKSGRMLAGSDIATVLATIEPFPVAAIGLNCGLGPEGMTAAVRYLAEHSSKLLSVMPNAGLPRMVRGRTVYDLGPREFAARMREFATGPGLNIAGGCCGTTPEHIAQLAKALKDVRPREPARYVPRVSSLYRSQEIEVRPGPLLIGERTNASGSRKFRELLQAGDHEGTLRAAREQEREGAHVIDLSVAVAGRNETRDMARVCVGFNTGQNLPVMIDSTSPDAVEAALQRLAGRCIVNSASLAEPDKARRMVDLCRKYGAALVLMAIDRRGMAMTSAGKRRVTPRLFRMAVEGGLPPPSLFFDFLTFTLGSGEPSLRGSAVHTLRAVRWATRLYWNSHTLLGVSNVSHGLAPHARRALNSVFLARAVQHGLSAAILHAGRILPLSNLKPTEARACDDLLLDRWRGGKAPLERFLAVFSSVRQVRPVKPVGFSGAERLREAVLRGEKDEVAGALDRVLQERSPLRVINRILLPAMDEVGRRFEAGRMQLPFVLMAAEAMKAALDRLRPGLPVRARPRATMVIGTVRGDVHDIGKNLVAMILSSNGFGVVDIGVRQTPEDFVAAIRRHRPAAVGMSGLLVESARAMREYVEAFAHAGVRIPVICGGAALSPRYVAAELQAAYPGPVRYAKDAIAGLRLMQQIARRDLRLPIVDCRREAVGRRR
jgi:5-methyltetrahydrofolate--homocysteine methyltransferase